MPVEGERYVLGAEEAVALRREHHRRGRDPRLHLHRRVRADRGDRAALDDLQERTGLDVPIHVDGASGGFVAPFIQPDLVWDFRLPRVKSINASGHKYGLAPLGVGWIIWRDAAELPDELVFHVNYLGGDMPIFAINFSRPGSQIIAQYYNFLRLGREGYRDPAELAGRRPLPGRPDRGDGPVPDHHPRHRPADRVVAVKDGANFTLFEFSDAVRCHGWQVPASSSSSGRSSASRSRWRWTASGRGAAAPPACPMWTRRVRTSHQSRSRVPIVVANRSSSPEPAFPVGGAVRRARRGGRRRPGPRLRRGPLPAAPHCAAR